jgi:UDP-N-acetylglucosamine--N-acetylmuramyl-(pentapeptide) pyrophosphoryl-undecaprenol N-acetylglucosamine transferase
MSGRPRPIVIAGGGTAGHVMPALAVARALVARGHDRSAVRFVGSRRGLEARLVPEAGFAVTLLPGRGVERRLSWRAAAAVGGLLVATAEAVALLARRRPGAVLSVGGYAAAPCALAALGLRIPLVVAEANAVPGATNRLAARWARASATAFDGTGLPRAVLTGTPVRDEVLAVARTPAARADARRQLGLPDGRHVIAVTGGSLGARRVNEAVLDLVDRWADRDDVAIHHALGPRDWAALSGRLPAPTGRALHYRAVEYEERVPALLSAADVWVGRSGGTTMAELTAVGVPSILVPLPIAPHDHQAVGARRLEAAGGCVVVLDPDCTGERLAAELTRLLTTPDALERMGGAAAAAGHRDAGDRIAALLEVNGRGLRDATASGRPGKTGRRPGETGGRPGEPRQGPRGT